MPQYDFELLRFSRFSGSHVMDCRQVAGHWIAIALSIMLFNIGIALASFFTTYHQQEWRIVGVSVLGTGLLMLIVIPLLIRRNIRSRYREAFRSLPEAELRRKRCSGHCIAWVLSAIHFVLGIAVTSFASDIRSKGWVVVGLVLVAMGIVSMTSTGVFIYASLRERKPMVTNARYREERGDHVIIKDTTQELFPRTPLAGDRKVVCVHGESSNNKDVQYMERRWQSNPDIYGDVTSDVIEDSDNCAGSSSKPQTSWSHITGSTVLQITKEKIIELSKMLDQEIPNWKLFGHKVAASNRCKIKKYKEFLRQINDCSRTPDLRVNNNNTQCTSSYNTDVRVEPLENSDRFERGNQLDNIISVESDGGIYIIDVCSSDKDIFVKDVTHSLTNNDDVIHNDVTTSQVCLKSPTVALFGLLKQHLPQLTLKEICCTLRDMGRTDVAKYIERSYLTNAADNIQVSHLLTSTDRRNSR